MKVDKATRDYWRESMKEEGGPICDENLLDLLDDLDEMQAEVLAVRQWVADSIMFNGEWSAETSDAPARKFLAFANRLAEFNRAKAEPARLDADKTAKPKTILTAPVMGENGPTKFPGPASTHVDLETGKRTKLR